MSPRRARQLGGLLAAAALIASCGREIDSRPAGSEPQEAPREAETATEPNLSLVPSPAAPVGGYRTQLYTERDADVYSLIDPSESTGEATFVRRIYVDVGTYVRPGQVLALLEDTRPALALEAAQARADEARARAARAKELLSREVIPAAEYETLRNAEREAEAQLKQARHELERTRVRAPFGGVVARRYVRVGQRVEPETPLFRVTAMAPLRARLLVPERNVVAFRRGATTRVTGTDGAAAEARVLLVGPTVDAASGTREVILELRTTSGFLPGAEVVVAVPTVEEADE